MKSKTEIFIKKTNYKGSTESYEFAKKYREWIEERMKDFREYKNLKEDDDISDLGEEFISFLIG